MWKFSGNFSAFYPLRFPHFRILTFAPRIHFTIMRSALSRPCRFSAFIAHVSVPYVQWRIWELNLGGRIWNMVGFRAVARVLKRGVLANFEGGSRWSSVNSREGSWRSFPAGFRRGVVVFDRTSRTPPGYGHGIKVYFRAYIYIYYLIFFRRGTFWGMVAPTAPPTDPLLCFVYLLFFFFYLFFFSFPLFPLFYFFSSLWGGDHPHRPPQIRHCICQHALDTGPKNLLLHAMWRTTGHQNGR